MSAYKALDDAIVKHLAGGGGHPIYATDLISFACQELGISEALGSVRPDRAWRQIDRRLQAMRKAGRLQHNRKASKWEVTP